MKIFFDTMVYLHYLGLDQIDFEDVFGPGPHSVVVPRITLRELDKHKNTGNSKRIKTRAKKVLRRVEDWLESGNVSAVLPIEFFAKSPSIDFEKFGLNPSWNDDVLIASILQYKIDNPSVENVVLVTLDSGAHMTAKYLGVRVFDLSDELLLPVDEDPIEQENIKLRKRISALEDMRPKIKVSFPGGKQHCKVNIFQKPELEAAEVESKIARLKETFPKREAPKLNLSKDEDDPVLKIQSLIKNSDLMSMGLNGREIERYNSEVESYITNYRKYMKGCWELDAAIARSFDFEIEIRNDGTQPAEDVDVHFHFPDGFRLVDDSKPMHYPAEPKEPVAPRSVSDLMEANARSSWMLPALGNVAPPSFEMPTSFSIEKTNSYDVNDHFVRIKHGDSVLLPRMRIIFESFEKASSFCCQYTIRPANLPEAITGELNFVVSKQ
ncbi:PIN domain-containing protein [Pelagicoccus sp. SDUM812002]|nr:PIN domain-containing protein [Pelagicoccus sp. SDUM812002]